VLLSCQEDVDIKIENSLPVKVAVEARIRNIKQHQLVRLTNSADYFANEPIKGAKAINLVVTETGTGKNFTFHEIDTIPGSYISDEEFLGKVGETYQLSFSYNMEDYQASAYLDTVPVIDSLSYFYEYFNYFGGAGFYQIKMSATEPEPAGDYYLFNLYINDSLYNDELRLTAYSDDEFINGKPLINIDLYYLPQEEIKQDTNNIRIEMISISREEYLFIMAFITETLGNGSLFAGPPADVPTNIENLTSDNSGLGFFSASSVSASEMILYKVHNDSTNNPDYTR
jgi:hypothetical protein